MMETRYLLIAACCVGLTATAGLATDAPPPATTALSAEAKTYFEKHIRPLLAQRCYACHSERANKQEGGLLLDRRAGWQSGGDRGAAIVPGDVDGSLLIQAIRYNDESMQMPPDKQLAADEIARLERWVKIGAPDPRDGSATTVTGANAADPVAGRSHWAFVPLATPAPIADASRWSQTPLDTWVADRRKAAGLRPAPDADRAMFLRRVYVQLIGLPPRPRQVREFVDDDRPDANARLVDKLLSSPRFGERWGRHWLDLARYADSNGLDENFLFREAWRYRNWVIDAVNADMPQSQFIREQLAGDLLPFDDIPQRDRQRIAAGFLVVGPKVLLGNNPQERIMDVADEQLDTIGRTLLGQTLGCARCHDHKFDPIPTSDYYALAGIFTSTQVMQQRYMLGQQRLMERLVGLGPEGDAANAAYEQYWRDRPKLQARQKQAAHALELLKKNDTAGLAAYAKQHPDAIAGGVQDTQQPQAERVAWQKALVKELSEAVAKPPGIPPRAMIPADLDKPADERIRLAGQFNRPGESVPRGFLRVLNPHPATLPAQHSGRLELAQWLVDEQDGAGHVVARVLANRAWHHLFGRGIVRTVDNFGRTGEPPSHPQLLDYLAGEYVATGWSLKSLVRRVVLSRTFALSGRHDIAADRVDPDNRWLWRANRRRLDPESFRDAMLSHADGLDLQQMRSTVWYLGDQATAVGDNKNRRRTDFPCRSVYLPVIRNDLPELFDVFDFADPHATTGMRAQTTVATQGLYTLNSDFMMQVSDATARRLLAERGQQPDGTAGDDAAVMDRLYERVLLSRPTDEERSLLLQSVAAWRTRLQASGNKEAELRAWSMVCHAVFASSRFQIVE